MFKGSRWRGEKNKIKAGFRLKFHATQVPLGWQTMVVTLVPKDVGKPTVRSEKAAVIGGECHWKNPIKETVKLFRDPKTGEINEKAYRFVISVPSSAKCDFPGEISINLADYAEMLRPVTVSLPLEDPSSSGVILHVTIQRMQADFERREGDGRKMISELKNCDEEEGGQAMTTDASKEDNSFIKNYAQLMFPTGRTLPPRAKSNGNLRNSSSTDYTSVSGSDSSSGQYTPEKAGTTNTKTHEDTASFFPPLKNKGIPRKEINGLIDLVKDYRYHWSQSSNTEWSVDAPPNGSMDWSTDNSVEIGSRERSENSDNLVDKHVSDDVTLARQLEVLELELQTLRKQVVMERNRGQDLSLELSGLKEERDALRSECEELKESHGRIGKENVSSWQHVNGEDLQSLLAEIKDELNHEKNSNAYLHAQLQKTQVSNNELFLGVQHLDELLAQKNKELTCPMCSRQATKALLTSEAFPGEGSGNAFSHSQSSMNKQDSFEIISEDDEQRDLETLVKEHDGAGVECSQEQKIIYLNSEIELYKKDLEDLEMHMEQLALDYEILKQENHRISSKLEQTQMQEQLQMQYECSAHVSIITELEAQVIILEKELEEQADSFEADIEIIARGKIEQEQRAIIAEEALTKTRSNTAKTVDQLKKDFERLSSQISSTYHINEKLCSQALKEVDELRSQKCHLEELLEKTNAELSSAKTSEGLLQEKNSRMEMLDKELASMREEVKKSIEQQNDLKQLSDEQEESINTLKFEIETFRAEYTELKRSLFEDDLEKENLSKQIVMLRDDLKKKEDSVVSMDKKLKDINERVVIADGTTKTTLENKNKSSPTPPVSKEVTSLREKIKLLEGKIKLKDDALEDTKNSFLMKEGDLSNRIEELERSIQSKLCFCEGTVYQEINNVESANGNSALQAKIGDQAGVIPSAVGPSERGKKGLIANNYNHVNLAELFDETENLKEKNKFMETQLKEMNERYSEMSLKFAELEGEREQLVMINRSLKSALKN